MSLVFLTEEHYHIHDGSHFYINDYLADLDIASPKNYLLITPSSPNEIHIFLDTQVTQISSVKIYEDADITDNGAAMDIFNRNRNSDRVSLLAIYEDPTINDDGDLIFDREFIVASQGVNLNVNAERGNNEFILKPDTNYLIRITTTVDNALASILIDFYED